MLSMEEMMKMRLIDLLKALSLRSLLITIVLVSFTHSNSFMVKASGPDVSSLWFASIVESPLTVQKEGCIIEVIPSKYQKRYVQWKTEYLSTEIGRQQWQMYAEKTGFTLYITVSKELRHGAEATRYEWDADGRLVSATILLGTKIDSGVPSTSNYPVTCSLAPSNLPVGVMGKMLAAAKLAHEFGHVNYTATQDAELYKLQNRLIPEYNRIFKLNGFNIDDARLLQLALTMRGTPSEISQEREYQAEANVVNYLQEKFSGRGRYKEMPQPIREAIDSYYQSSFR